ncbi:MAG: glycoside hydrolase family 16 protein [Bacteroidales bacterium]|jgi:beta-glucanase (GH16 family)|nr:glycoside hydrolase family 16 protein [Bacteroidales bacterium]
MKKELMLMILTGIFVFPTFAQHPSQDQNWIVIFQDDFTSFNTVRWNKANNHIHGDEPQVYINTNVYTENGKLLLLTKKQNYPCPKGVSGCPSCQYTGIHSYTSGQIRSKLAYKYGYYEIYAKLPASSGYWPAFWFWHSGSTNTGCWYNEIDVFEASGCKTNTVESRVHWGFQCPSDAYGSSEAVPHSSNYSTGYHWYGVEWTANKITWYVDRNPVRSINNNMGGIGIQNPMYIIINVALFPNGWGCNVSSSSIFPNYMYVDQANAYRLKCDKTTVVNEIPNYNTFYYAVKKSISLSSASSLSVGQNISLKATDFIELKNGFEIPLGVELYLDITSCE